MTIGEAAERRPSVGVEAVNVVERVDLAHDGGNVVVHVGREHAGAEELRIVSVELWTAVWVAHRPFGMSRERVGPVEVGTHAGDDLESTLAGGGDTLAEEVASIEEFDVTMERHLRWI